MNDKPSPSAPPKRAGNGSKKEKTSAPSSAPDIFASGYDFLLVNGRIDEELFSRVVRRVVDNRKNKKIVICLVTYGGQANAAYRIGRLLQALYDEVVAMVPSLCKSAGTLIVIAANKVVMSVTGEIGPLDVQLSQRDEILGIRSGLTTRSALKDLRTQAFDIFNDFILEITQRSSGNISFRVASEIAAKVTAGCMSPIYDKINPDALGQDLRDLNVATEYGKRLNARARNLQVGAINRLVHDYPSHDFVIDYDEAKEIFVDVSRPTNPDHA